MPRTRQPNGRSGINIGADKRYHCWVTIGVKPDGSLDRKHVSGATATKCAENVEALLARMNRGGGIPAKIETVADWLTYWLEHIVRPNLSYNTWVGYRIIVQTHTIPVIGGYRLDGTRHRIEPEHAEMMENGLKKTLAPSYVLQVHRVLSKAFDDAVQRGKASRNVFKLIKKPRARAVHVPSLSLTDAQAIITTAADDPMAARWLLGILVGLRQGEALGLRWHRLDLEATPPLAHIVKQNQRRTWEHGCEDPHGCAVRHCRKEPCQQPCKVHHGKAGCPAPCDPDCIRHARACKQRTGGGIVEVDTKSDTGRDQGTPIPTLVADSLREIRERQIRERAEIGMEWDPEGLVFTSPLGKPIDPRRDHERWEELLVTAGVADRELHAARHTAGTLMVAGGTDIAVVQEILHHADIRTTRRYVDVANELKAQAVERLAATLFDGALGDLLKAPTAPNLHR